MKTIILQVFMTEHIVVYHESDFTSPIVVDRGRILSKQIDPLSWIFHIYGRCICIYIWRKMILQKRGPHVKTSPRKLHTAVGGHINPHEVVSFTLLHECIEEFWAPSYIVPESMSLGQAIDTLYEYRDRVIVVRPLCFWELDYVASDEFSSVLSEKNDMILYGEFLDESHITSMILSRVFILLELEAIDEQIASENHNFTNSFVLTYQNWEKNCMYFDRKSWVSLKNILQIKNRTSTGLRLHTQAKGYNEDTYF